MQRDGMSSDPTSTASPAFSVRIEPLGATLSVTPPTTLLAGARAAGIDLPSSCRNGTCRACMAQLTAGHVDHLIEWPGLSADEKLEGCILPCVSTPVSDLVVWAPLARPAATSTG